MSLPTIDEPVFFQTGPFQLTGILSRPAENGRGIGIVLASGASPTMVSFQRNRFAARLARDLAGAGFHALRFDYRGAGDSGGPECEYSLTEPLTADLVAAAGFLRGIGLRRCVLVGSCYGARTALAAADQVEGLEGVLLAAMAVTSDFDLIRADRRGVSAYLRNGVRASRLRELLNGDRRRAYALLVGKKATAVARRLVWRIRGSGPGSLLADDLVVEQLRALLARRCPVVFLFGAEDGFYRIFRNSLKERLGTLLHQAGDLVEIRVEPDCEMHGFTTVPAQEAFARHVRDWIEARVVSGRSRSLG